MTMSEFRLDGKVSLVTGGSRGIGRAIALAFANAGADVAISSRNLPDIENVAKEIISMGKKSLAIAAHLGRIEELKSLVQKTMDYFGKIDILVNNAATNPIWAPILESDERLWDSIINLNLKGPFFLSQMVAAIMKEQGGGCIINMASVEGFRVGDRTPIYDISKAGLIHFTRAAAFEWAKYNIRVNAIAPGFVQTRLTHSLWENNEYRDVLESKIPLGHIAQPEDIAGAAVYLASDAAQYTTGSILVIDGGLTLGI